MSVVEYQAVSKVRILKIAVTALLLGYALSASDVRRLPSLIAEVRLPALLVLLPLMALDRLVAAARIRRLFRAIGESLGLWRILSNSLVGIYFGYFMPSSVGVDAFTAYLLGRRTGAMTHSVAVVSVDRVISFSATVSVGLLLLFWYSEWASAPSAMNVSIAVGVVVLAAVAGFLVLEQLSERAARSEGVLRRFGLALRSLLDAVGVFVRSPAALAFNIMLAFTLLALRIAQLVVLAWALNIDIPWYFVAFSLCTAAVVLVIPISFGGIGLREATFVSLFGLAGYAEIDGLALSLGLMATDLLFVLAGGWIYATHKQAFFRHTEQAP